MLGSLQQFHLSEAGADHGEQVQCRGDTGGDGQDLSALQNQVSTLQSRLDQVKRFMTASLKEKAELKAGLDTANAKVAQLEQERVQLLKAAEEKPTTDVSAVSKEAARQRLRRLCERKADGSIAVSEDIHQQWVSGGANRDKLLRIFIDTGLDKVRVGLMMKKAYEYIMAMHPKKAKQVLSHL